jgi:hypothetical protein
VTGDRSLRPASAVVGPDQVRFLPPQPIDDDLAEHCTMTGSQPSSPCRRRARRRAMPNATGEEKLELGQGAKGADGPPWERPATLEIHGSDGGDGRPKRAGTGGVGLGLCRMREKRVDRPRRLAAGLVANQNRRQAYTCV